MLKKYNITINVLFWILVAAVITVFALTLLKPGLKLNSYLFGVHKEVIIQKEPVKITEYREVEKNIEWYYFVATAYSKNDATQGTDSVTATGETVREGIIAVDPEVIPYGTLIEIKDMGYFVAEDCGGKIKGNRIDIYFDSKQEAKEFGKQGIWLRVIGNSYMQLAEMQQH
ncbi:MAG: hypothetical protein FJW66_07175 [Actinobacteria bacterium]|nr:hypothetical protein [Actinomycetota bacterium]